VKQKSEYLILYARKTGGAESAGEKISALPQKKRANFSAVLRRGKN
jgi:hypothetical protein